MAPISSDGTYQVTSQQQGQGLPAGSYKVTIEATKQEGGTEPEPAASPEDVYRGNAPMPQPDAQESKTVYLVPEKYAYKNSSPLTETVTESTTEINFELPKN